MSAQRPVFFDGRDFRRLSSSDFLDPDVLDSESVRADGSVGFTGTQAGVAPENPNDLTTAQWVWDAIEDGAWMAPVEDTLNTPPSSPTEGQRWLVDTSPAGDWEGQAGNIAVWRGGWVFVEPQHGSVVIVRATNRGLTYNGTEWVSAAKLLVHNGLVDTQGGQTGEYYHLTATQHDQLVNAETVTMDLTAASENDIATIPDISSITTVEWAVTLYDLVTPRATRYNIMASHVDGVSSLTVSGLGPDYGESFDIGIISGPPNDLVLRVRPDGADWNAIVTRTVVHRA